MAEKVFFIPVQDNVADEVVAEKLKSFLLSENLLASIEERDLVAIKTHFGETRKSGYPRPELVKALGEVIYHHKGLPFITETSCLYKGKRNNAVEHMMLAHRHGFGTGETNLPVIMADGILGDEEIEVPINGELYQKVKIASLVGRLQGMVLLTHFTGHLASGFGAALKNLGMGLASRKGKLHQHSTAQPTITVEKCISCGVCVKWCPEDAVSMNDESAVIDEEKCIGCGECLAVCRFDAVGYNWAVTYEDLQKKVVEHASGVVAACPGKILCVTLLTRISKDCDCLSTYEKIAPDIGILISEDPVAVDAAALDLVEKHTGKSLGDLAYNIPYRCQMEHAKAIGFGSTEYDLITVE